jgi:hypothetical protein
LTWLFNTDVQESSARRRSGVTTMDASRSYIERVSSYPENIEAVATITYTRTPTPLGAAPAPVPLVVAGGMRQGSATVVRTLGSLDSLRRT